MNPDNLYKSSANSLIETSGRNQLKMATASIAGLRIPTLPTFRLINAHYLPAGGYHRDRNHFDRAFLQIGLSIIAGGTAGSVGGLFKSIPLIQDCCQSRKLRRTQILNRVITRGMSTANFLGSLAFLYSVCNILVHQLRKDDDKINHLTAATLTGMLYRSTAGLRNCAVGGGIGLGLSASYYLLHINAIAEFIGQKFLEN